MTLSLGQTAGQSQSCIPPGVPPDFWIIGAGVIGLLLFPGWWKLLPGAVCASAIYDLFVCTGPGELVGNAAGNTECLRTTNSSCILSL
jgi:hypothetical protein